MLKKAIKYSLYFILVGNIIIFLSTMYALRQYGTFEKCKISFMVKPIGISYEEIKTCHDCYHSFKNITTTTQNILYFSGLQNTYKWLYLPQQDSNELQKLIVSPITLNHDFALSLLREYMPKTRFNAYERGHQVHPTYTKWYPFTIGVYDSTAVHKFVIQHDSLAYEGFAALRSYISQADKLDRFINLCEICKQDIMTDSLLNTLCFGKYSIIYYKNQGFNPE